MSLEHYKQFIELISLEHSLTLKTSWKRIDKFLENNLTFTKFENQQGDEILISEDKTGKLNLISVEKSIEMPAEIKKNLNSTTLFTELYKLFLDVVSTSNSLEENLNVSEIQPLSPKAIRKYLLLKDDSYLKQELQDYKPSSKEDLQIGYEILSILSYDSEDNVSIPVNNFVRETSSEHVGILYDKENMDLYYIEKEGISFFQAICGGDWEMPISFLVYWSDSEGRLKGFFPKGDANIYNLDYDCAYGSEHEKVHESNFPTRAAYDKVMNDLDNKMGYINENYHKLTEKALNKAFKQLKKIIIEENLSKKMKPLSFIDV